MPPITDPFIRTLGTRQRCCCACVAVTEDVTGESFFRDFVLEPELAPDRVRLRWLLEGSDTSRRLRHGRRSS
jgi:hypothetical protein